MDNSFCRHGQTLFKVAVIHGGPGAAGDIADLAKELSKDCGVLEPYQTANTIAGQINELKEIIEKNAEIPVILIGHSWGAVLSFLVAAANPKLVQKLIMISCPPLTDQYAKQITKTRRSRLTPDQQKEITKVAKILNSPRTKNIDEVYAQFGQLITKADAYNLLPTKNKIIPNYEICQKIWPEFYRLRKSGGLVELGKKIVCPVLAIHGDYDPHPAKGVEKPLSSVIKNFQFVLLENCSHYPWREAEAKEQFYQIVKNEL
jgi:pimeloyl-ACP methyl ester carboxylesterase